MSIFRSSLFFSLGTILSRVSGLIRESAMAGVFGAGLFMDAFLVAFRIPNLLRDMLAEGALSGAFTKVYTSICEDNPKAASDLYFSCLRLFLVVGIVVVMLGIWFAPELVRFMTLSGQYSGDAEFQDNAVLLTRLLFPFLIFPILSALTMGVLHRHGNFFVSGFSPVYMNLGYIFGALVLARYGRWASFWGMPDTQMNNAVIGLALGVLLGGFMQFIFPFFTSLRCVKWEKPFVLLWRSEAIKKVLILMAPAAIAASAGPIAAFINTNFATSLGEGAVSWLYFAFRLLQLPVGVFGVAIGMAALPALTRSIARSGGKVGVETSEELQRCLQTVLWIMVPAGLLLFVAADAMITLFFQHARFTGEDSLATSRALQAYSFGVLGYGLIKVLTSYYFSVERTRYAMAVSLTGIGVTFIMNYLLVKSLGHVGLATASSVTLSLNALLLLFGTRKDKVTWNWVKLRRTFMGLFSAVGICIAICYMAQPWLMKIDLDNVKLTSLVQIIFYAGILTIVFFIAILRVEKKTPLQLIRS